MCCSSVRREASISGGCKARFVFRRSVSWDFPPKLSLSEPWFQYQALNELYSRSVYSGTSESRSGRNKSGCLTLIMQFHPRQLSPRALVLGWGIISFERIKGKSPSRKPCLRGIMIGSPLADVGNLFLSVAIPCIPVGFNTFLQ